MKINLKQLFSIVGEVRDFSYELAADELGFVKGLEFGAPVKIEGRLYNRAGVVYLNYTVNALVLHTCDRCLKEFERDYRFSFEHIVVPSVNSDNDEYITADGESIEMNDIAVTDFEHMHTDIQIKDFCYFLRKAMEKNQWKQKTGQNILEAYESVRQLKPDEREYLCLRLAYPEKFWKIANHYYNANKAWGFGRYLEKLEKIKAEEENREQFLAYMKHFAYS